MKKKKSRVTCCSNCGRKEEGVGSLFVRFLYLVLVPVADGSWSKSDWPSAVALCNEANVLMSPSPGGGVSEARTWSIVPVWFGFG